MFGKKSAESATPTVPAAIPGRNEPCHCGSGKKYKKCHEDKDAAAVHTKLEKQWTEAEKNAAKQAEEASEKQSSGASEQASPKHRSSDAPMPGPQKHSAPTIPKFNMPRKTGGGG